MMRFFQSAAESQLAENGMSYDDLKEAKRAFILSRITIKILDECTIGDNLVASTYPTDSRGYTFLRCFGITRGGAPIAMATSAWALIDTESRGLIRVDGFPLGLNILPKHDLELGRFILPGEMQKVGIYTVGYGDIDRNRHMNNTVYPDVYMTFIPEENMRISEITVSYRSEAVIGEILTVFMSKNEDRIYFKTVKEDGTVNTEAEIKLI
jgi:acyl-ACP thioesterase